MYIYIYIYVHIHIYIYNWRAITKTAERSVGRSDGKTTSVMRPTKN